MDFTMLLFEFHGKKPANSIACLFQIIAYTVPLFNAICRIPDDQLNNASP